MLGSDQENCLILALASQNSTDVSVLKKGKRAHVILRAFIDAKVLVEGIDAIKKLEMRVFFLEVSLEIHVKMLQHFFRANGQSGRRCNRYG